MKDELESIAEQMAKILQRYRNETPAGHSPSMICHEADEILAMFAAWNRRTAPAPIWGRGRSMVEVTQADREAAASVAVLVEMRELILAGKADHHAEPWARHREAGRRAGLEEAYDAARGTNADEYHSGQMAYFTILEAIRARIGDGHE